MVRFPIAVAIGCVFLVANLPGQEPIENSIRGTTFTVTDDGGKKAAPGAVVYFPSNKAPAPKAAQLHIRNAALTEPLLVVHVGQELNVEVDTPSAHQIVVQYMSGDSDRQPSPFVPTQQTKYVFQFSRPGLVKLYCTVSPQVTGLIFVAPQGYSTQSDANGEFQLKFPKSDPPQEVLGFLPGFGSTQGVPQDNRVSLEFAKREPTKPKP